MEIDWNKPAVELVEELRKQVEPHSKIWIEHLDCPVLCSDYKNVYVAIELALSSCKDVVVISCNESNNRKYLKLQEMKQIVLSKINQ